MTLPAHIALPQRLLRPALASRSCFSRQPARLKDFKLRPHATASAKAKTSFTKEAADLQELATRLHSERGAQDKVALCSFHRLPAWNETSKCHPSGQTSILVKATGLLMEASRPWSAHSHCKEAKLLQPEGS